MNNKVKIIKYIVVLVVISIHAFITFCFFEGKHEFVFFPNEKAYGSAFNDNYNNGNSEIISRKVEANKFAISYILRKGSLYPYCGLYITHYQNVDISNYDVIHLSIKTNRLRALHVNLKIYIEGITRPDDFRTYLYLENRFVAQKGKHTYTLPLRGFKIAKWWTQYHNMTRHDLMLKNKNQLYIFEVVDLLREEGEQKSFISIEGVTFVADNKSVIYISISIFILYMFFIVLYSVNSVIKKKTIEKIQKAFIPYQSRKVEKENDPDIKKLLQYLEHNFNKPDISVTKVNQDTGIEKTKISKIIKNTLNLTFPQYIHSLRLAEAKRLLVGSDMKVIDIGYFVGFSSLSNFNKMFRKIENKTPKEFRLNLKK